MSFFQAKKVRTAMGGRWLVEPSAEGAGGAAIDSRSVQPGDMFFAFAGERVDGHDYVGGAARAGAWIAVVEREIEIGPFASGFGVLLVERTVDALGSCARAYRETLHRTRVIGVTGSNGKTTTTRMIDAALGATVRGSASIKSFNNEIGVPLTILNAKADDEYLVCEIGSNHSGEIAALAEIVQPDIAVITSVARAHLEGFGSIEGVASEKASLARGVRNGGAVIATAESSELLAALAGVECLTTYGPSDGAMVTIGRVREEASCTVGEVDGIGTLRLAMLGEHNVMNATAAVLVARCMGVDLGAAMAAIEGLKAPPMRLERCEVGGVHVINDAYNANPDSMLAAVRTLAAIDAPGRKLVVLGDMLEIGDDGEGVHREVGEALVSQAAADVAVFVGAAMRVAADCVYEAWGDGRVVWMETLDAGGAAAAASVIEAGDTVLLKGSRAMGVERVAEALEARSHADSQREAIRV